MHENIITMKQLTIDFHNSSPANINSAALPDHWPTASWD